MKTMIVIILILFTRCISVSSCELDNLSYTQNESLVLKKKSFLGNVPNECIPFGQFIAAIDDNTFLFSCDYKLLLIRYSNVDGLNGKPLTLMDLIELIYNKHIVNFDKDEIYNAYFRKCGGLDNIQIIGNDLLYEGEAGDCIYNRTTHNVDKLNDYWHLFNLNENDYIYYDFDGRLYLNNIYIQQLQLKDLGIDGQYMPTFMQDSFGKTQNTYIVTLSNGDQSEPPYDRLVTTHNVLINTWLLAHENEPNLICDYTFNRLLYLNGFHKYSNNYIVFSNCLNEIGEDTNIDAKMDYCTQNEFIIYDPLHCSIVSRIEIDDIQLIKYRTTFNSIIAFSIEGLYRIY